MIDFPIITLAEAKHQLRIAADNTYHDADLELRIPRVTDIVLRYYKVISVETIPPDWVIPDTSPVQYQVPQDVKEWVLVALSESFENREAGIQNILSDGLKALIPRTPTLA